MSASQGRAESWHGDVRNGVSVHACAGFTSHCPLVWKSKNALGIRQVFDNVINPIITLKNVPEVKGQKCFFFLSVSLSNASFVHSDQY